MCVAVCVIHAHKCAGVHGSSQARGGQKGVSGTILYHYLLYCLEIRCLIAQEAGWPANS